jgi:hypothetical protein
MKFKVDSVSQSERLQRVLFSLGYKWYVSTEQTTLISHLFPVIMTYESGDMVRCTLGGYDWYINHTAYSTESFIAQHLRQGSSEHTNKQESKMKPHKHAELIKKWADGVEIEFQFQGTKTWCVAESPNWVNDTVYRVKPSRVFPVTSLTEDQLDDYVTHSGANGGCIFTIAANAAIKQYILDTEK